MKRSALLLACLGLNGMWVGAEAATTPEEVRLKIVQAVEKKFPDIRFADYVYGALAFSPDAMGQYTSLMEFPPFETEIDKGRKLWETPLKSGRTYADCLPNGGSHIAGNYPYFDDLHGKVVTFEMAINDCRVANGEEPYKHADMATMGLLTAYARTLSDGMKMNIKVEGAAAHQAFDAGRKEFFRRKGQLNFSCATCHVDNVGNILRTEYLSMAPGQATHWPAFRSGDYVLWTLQRRYSICNTLVRAAPAEIGGETYNNLEYFHSYLSNGLPLKAAVFRK